MSTLRTPDGRYLVVSGRLWRATDPALAADEKQRLVSELMSARRAVRDSEQDIESQRAARRRVHNAKLALGERGPVWWTDGQRDYTRCLVENTPYGPWYAAATA
ncbi:hypothetical protein [Botrimarina sp.]|uniref:hypothetical protein n=1 Tax=Botrimarina sp. TaxID=2795802 RepID=UPI0032EFC642